MVNKTKTRRVRRVQRRRVGRGVFSNVKVQLKTHLKSYLNRTTLTKVKNHLVQAAKDKVKERIQLGLQGPRNTISPTFRSFLQQHGDKQIQTIWMGRVPIQSGVKKVADWISNGAMTKAQMKLGYDDIYHNYLIVVTTDGARYRIEKSHVVAGYPTSESSTNLFSVPVTKALTINQLIENAAANDANFWLYDARDSNCQVFVKEDLSRNGLTAGLSEQAKALLKPQNSEQLVDSLGLLKKLPRVLTDVVGAADRVLYGDGVKGGGQFFSGPSLKWGPKFLKWFIEQRQPYYDDNYNKRKVPKSKYEF